VNVLHLFPGSGGGLLAERLLGHTCCCAVEIESYCIRNMQQRQRDGLLPLFPIANDVRQFNARPWKGIADCVAGGFPCQDISVAGKGAGIAGEPAIPRTAKDIPNRVARLKAIGNGQVPLAAWLAWTILWDRIHSVHIDKPKPTADHA